jgi:hypothetical protein
MSDLDDETPDPVADAGACWTTCLGLYPDTLVAIDYDGESCYCQDECRCMYYEGVEDAAYEVITVDSILALPD